MAGPWSLARVAGLSMSPVLRDGDLVVVRRTARPRRGTVVVARHPAKDLLVVKRLDGVPGDPVYGAPLGPDQWWLSSDNPLAAADDSRSFGPIGADAIVGRVVLRYWPPRRTVSDRSAS